MKIKDIDQNTFISLFENELRDSLSGGSSILDEGMRYAMLDGGKRIRPLCVYFGARAVGGDVCVDVILSLALGIEFIHGYSLVHDDLPAMDNDDYRRGKPSVHKKFGYANGILIGDQLLTQAMCTLVGCNKHHDHRIDKATVELARAAKFMAYGQAEDLSGCRSLQEYLDMYSKKTGALISSAFGAGALCAGAESDTLDNVKRFADVLGLAFQIADDLIDEDDDNSILTVIGCERAKQMLNEQTEKAYRLARLFDNPDELVSFTQKLCIRNI